MRITHIEARPLKPSMMLTAWATPVMTKTVTTAAPAEKPTTQSSPGMSVRTITLSTRYTASAADTAVKNRRRRGLCALVRSSASPAANTGSAASSRPTVNGHIGASSQAAQAAPAATPRTMPTPPMRGTGRA